MDRKPARYLAVIVFTIFIACAQVSAHPPSDLKILDDPDSNSILVTLTHRVNDPSSHYVHEIEISKNSGIIDTLQYTGQPSIETFTYRYPLQLNAGDTVIVTARCNIGGSITSQYKVPGTNGTIGPISANSSPWSYTSLLPIHAVMMSVAFLLFLLSALLPLAGRRIKAWYRLHTLTSAFGGVLTILAMGIAYTMVSLSGGPNIRVPHAWLGLLMLVILFLILGLAFIRRNVPVERKKLVRSIHLWLGRLLVLIMAINIIAGLNTAGLL
ncbi:MAG: Eukaryotic cytochrome b561 [Methanoregulaceae archaeon PtaB.Bin108]|nr:MAG: Eukaryotic cytochrome b561 [Methanoregulaceae archaeon PtaB.Bin108]